MLTMRGLFRLQSARRAEGLAVLQRLFMLGVVLAMTLGSVAWQPAAAQTAPFVTTDNVNLRSAPEDAAEALVVIPVGTTVEVTGSAENGFYPVTWDGLSGYVLADYLVAGDEATIADEPAATSAWDGPTGTWYVTGGALNLREGPGTSYDVVVQVPDGTPLELTGEVSGEFSAVILDETPGWVATIYLSATAPVVATEELPGETPVATTPAPTEEAAVGGEGDEAMTSQLFSLQETPVGIATVVTGGLTLNLRSGPSTSFGIVGRIPNGATVDVMGSAENGFLPVRYQGTAGYASSQYLRVGAASTPTATATPTSTPTTPVSTPGGTTPVGSAVVTTQGVNLNLRNGPSTGATVIGSLPPGATVEVMGAAQAGFLPVRYQGKTGWASTTYLRVGSAPTPTATTTPVTPTATAVTPTATPLTPTATSTPGGSTGTAVVITDGLNLNLRNAPSATATIVGRIPSGASVEVTGAAQNGFLPVRYSGISGWASASWLSFSANPTPTATASATPVTPTTTPVTPTQRDGDRHRDARRIDGNGYRECGWFAAEHAEWTGNAIPDRYLIARRRRGGSHRGGPKWVPAGALSGD